MTLLGVDFDGVIHDPQNVRPGYKMGQPMEGAITAMRSLYDEGFELVVFTVRATTLEGERATRDWLNYFEVPHHRVTAIKPNGLIIDNNAIRFHDWAQALGEIAIYSGSSRNLPPAYTSEP